MNTYTDPTLALLSRLDAHQARVDRVAQNGGTVPKAWTTARARHDAWTAAEKTSAREQLVQAYERGDDESTLAVLRQAALIAETVTPVQRANVTNSVVSSAYAQHTQAYKPVAAKNYSIIAKRFNDKANEFSDCANIVDVESPAESLMNADNDTRKAYVDSVIIAKELDQLASVLADASRLAGKAVKGDPGMLGLTVNARGLHRRRVWDAWASSGRTGHWGALVALGATIQAPESTDDVKPYREPKPLEVQYIRGNIGVRTVQIDPEDDDPTANVQLRDGEAFVTML